MKNFFLVIVLSFQIVFSNGNLQLDPGVNIQQPKNGSHNLLSKNNSSGRKSRCVPCGDDRFDRPVKMPVSNHLNPEYRGNGADNLGYDWSPMAWGGLAFPHRSKMFMIGMQGRDGRQMGKNMGQSQGNVHIICDTCRAYWDGSMGLGPSNGGQLGGQGNYGSGGRSSFMARGRMMRPQDFEARVSSPTVGVLVKPGSRIAYIPSKSGDMFWDGVSGGGTRWDGFSNGISWVMNGSPDWARMDLASRERKPENYDPTPQGPGKNFPYFPQANRPWDEQKGISGYDSSGKGYYFINGYPNQIDPQSRERGYASNWHYGSTDQNGWNGNNMKWNYGAKNWDDSDRSANRFYFNAPQDREFGYGGGNYQQYSDRYPTYQREGSFLGAMGFFPYWQPSQGFRMNDRDPTNFHNDGDKGRPWDYNRFGNQRPNFRPDGRPGFGLEGSGNVNKGTPGRYPLTNRYDKLPSPDKNDGPGVVSFGYGPNPGSGGGYPFGGTHFPDRYGNRRPDKPPGEHLFYPHTGQPTYPDSLAGSRPFYQGGDGRPGNNPASENQINNYLGGGKDPSLSYGSGRPFGGDSTGYSRPEIGGSRPTSGYQGFPGGTVGVRPEVYPTGGSFTNRYPGGYRPENNFGGGSRPSSGYIGEKRPEGGYPGGGSRPDGGYPGGGSRPDGGYPSGGSRPDGGYPSGGSRPDGGYPSGGSRPDGGYPSGGNRPDGGYPSGGSRPDGGYPSGGSRPDGGYPSGGSRPDGGYPSGGSRPDGGYPGGGSRPDGGYPSGGSRPEGGYPGGGSRPDGGYPSGGSRPDGGYPGGGSRPDGGYPSGGIRPDGGYPSGGYRPGGGYQSGGSRPSYFGGGIPQGNYPNDYGSGNSRPNSYPSGGSLTYPYSQGGYPFGGSTFPKGYAGEKPTLYPTGNYPGDHSSYPGGGSYGYTFGAKNLPKGHYTGFITELDHNRGRPMFSDQNNFDNNYSGDKNTYSGLNPYKGDQFSRYPNDFKGGYLSPNENRFPSNDNYGSGGKDTYPGGDRFYFYGQHMGHDKYPGDYHSGGNSGSDYDRNPSFGQNKNSWNYGENDRKDGIYRRSGGSYPPYKGGQYFTSSYLASMSTPSGSTQEGSETKTQTVTKPDEVTPSTSQSS